LASNDIIKGDTVRYILEGKVTDASIKYVDIENADGQILYGIDKKLVARTKKAPWRSRQSELLSASTVTSICAVTEAGCTSTLARALPTPRLSKWEVFGDHSAVRIMTAGDFVTNR